MATRRNPHETHRPVGLAEIAAMLGLKRQSVDVIRHRGGLPEARWIVSGRPLWCLRCDILPFARGRGHAV
jgi:hypothetical protein